MSSDEKRSARRFEIDCPVSVRVQRGGQGEAAVSGCLFDIALGGARLYLGKPLQPGTRVVLDAHFDSSGEHHVTVRFEGTVVRVQETQSRQVAIRFRCGGRFLREAGPLGPVSRDHRA